MTTLTLEVVKSPFNQPVTMWRLEPEKGEYVLGRSPTNDIVIVDPYASRKHARIFYRDGKWYIEDLGSTNGTVVDGEPLEEGKPVELKDGSEIVVGLTVLRVKMGEEEEGEEESE